MTVLSAGCISSTAAILERLADAEMQRGSRHLGNALGQLGEDLALAHDTLAPLPGYLTRRAAA